MSSSSNKNLSLHLVGKLQSNKTKLALKIFDYIHSLDNEKLANKISEEQKKMLCGAKHKSIGEGKSWLWPKQILR